MSVQINMLKNLLAARFPEAAIELQEPKLPDGVWWLDFNFQDTDLTVEWSHARGFGVTSDNESSYGELPHELYSNVDSVYSRLIQLVLNEEYTLPFESIAISNLRESRGITQVELAGRMGLKQPAISKIERKEDMMLSVYVKMIEALDGVASVGAIFEDKYSCLYHPRPKKVSSLYILDRCQGDINSFFGERVTLKDRLWSNIYMNQHLKRKGWSGVVLNSV